MIERMPVTGKRIINRIGQECPYGVIVTVMGFDLTSVLLS
jgi:hypothetical protein